MAYDSEAREAGSSGIAIGLVALVLIAAVAGFVYLQQSPERVAVIDHSSPSTTVVQPPAVQSPPVVNVNPAPAAPASGSGSSSSSDSSAGTGSSSKGTAE